MWASVYDCIHILKRSEAPNSWIYWFYAYCAFSLWLMIYYYVFLDKIFNVSCSAAFSPIKCPTCSRSLVDLKNVLSWKKREIEVRSLIRPTYRLFWLTGNCVIRALFLCHVLDICSRVLYGPHTKIDRSYLWLCSVSIRVG